MMRADGSDVLERIVRLPKIKGTVYSLLSDVSQQSGYMFIYDSKVIDNDAVVKIKGGERSIRQAVYDIVGNTSLEFQVMGTHILDYSPPFGEKGTCATRFCSGTDNKLCHYRYFAG